MIPPSPIREFSHGTLSGSADAEVGPQVARIVRARLLRQRRVLVVPLCDMGCRSWFTLSFLRETSSDLLVRTSYFVHSDATKSSIH